MIKVVVAGALGRMGQESCRALVQTEGIQLVGAVDTREIGSSIGPIIGVADLGIKVSDNLAQVIAEQRPDVLVDFTRAGVVQGNIELALKNGVRPVVGTTGMSAEEIKTFTELAASQGVGGLIAPNFAIGALLMIKFAAEAAKYLPHVEIIELHHDKKVDAPSGTALKTAEAIAQVRGNMAQGMPSEFEKSKVPGVVTLKECAFTVLDCLAM